MLAEAVGCETARDEVGLAACDHVEDRRPGCAAYDLGGDVREQLLLGETSAGDETHRDGRVEVAARDVPDRVRHREDRQSEGECHTEQANPKVGESRRQYGCTASTKDEPERAEQLRRHSSRERHGISPFVMRVAAISGRHSNQLRTTSSMVTVHRDHTWRGKDRPLASEKYAPTMPLMPPFSCSRGAIDAR